MDSPRSNAAVLSAAEPAFSTVTVLDAAGKQVDRMDSARS